MRKIAASTFMLVFMLFSCLTANAQSPIGVVVDDREVAFTTVAPFTDENNRTMVPLKAVGEAIGLTVSWDDMQQKASFTKGYTWENSPIYRDTDGDGEYDAYLGLESISFKIGDKKAIHDMQWYDKGTSPDKNNCSFGGYSEINMDTAAIVKDSRTYAPIKYLAEAFRYHVGWNAETRTVILNNMYSVDKLGIHVEQVAGWKDSQGWMFTVDENSNIQSMDILSIDGKDSGYSILTDEEQRTIYDSGNKFGKYLNGFKVERELEINTHYEYNVTFLATMKDGTQRFGFANIDFYFGNGQGGYI